MFDPETCCLIGRAGSCRVTPQQARILAALVQKAGRPVKYAQLIEATWFDDDEPDHAESVVKTQICKIRRTMRAVACTDRLDSAGRSYVWHPGEACQPFCPTLDQRTRLKRLIATHPDRRLAAALGAAAGLL